VEAVTHSIESNNDPSTSAFSVPAVSLASVNSVSFFPHFLAHEHARVFRQFLVRRLAIIALAVLVGWRWLQIVPTGGLIISLGVLSVVGVGATLLERRARRRLGRDVVRRNSPPEDNNGLPLGFSVRRMLRSMVSRPTIKVMPRASPC